MRKTTAGQAGDLVSQRLEEVQNINKRAVNLRKMNVEAIRSNFGVDSMDTSGYSNQAPAVGGNSAPSFDAGKEARYQAWKKSNGK